MKVFKIILTAVALLLATHTHAQNVPATDAAVALDNLRSAILGKIDDEVQNSAHAFADAQNIHNSLIWSDWCRPFLDITLSVFDGLQSVGDIPGSPLKDSNAVRGWFKTSLQTISTGKNLHSLFGSFDRFRQDGAGLALAIDGPAYNSAVSTMLAQADAASFFFNYNLYSQSIVNSLYGYDLRSNPIRISHKSTNLDRRGGGIFNSVWEARSYISSQLSSLSAQLRWTQLPADRISDLTSFINARLQDIQQAKVGHRSVTYQAYLSNGTILSQRQVSYSLGTISQLGQWRVSVLNQFNQSVGFDTIGITGRLVEKAGDFVLHNALDDATETINLNLNVQAVISGQAGANDILKDATSLGISFAMPDIGNLADQAQSFVSNSREQINMIPQQMVDSLPGETSKTLLLVDDTIKYAQITTTPPAIPTIKSISPPMLTAMPQTQRLTITGSGFTSGSTLIFNNGVQSYNSDPARLTYVSSTEIKYDIAVGIQAAAWTVKVVNGTTQSSPGSFYVTTAPDTTAPSAPIGLNVSPSPWAGNDLFTLDWTNPNDSSGIVKVWWKLGSPPVSPTDGLSSRLPLFKPLPITINQSEGTQMVYVWLEDGAGNKNHGNRATATLRLDTTRPIVSITPPTATVTSQSSIILGGTFADNLSGVATVKWFNDAGGNGDATMSGSVLSGTWTTGPIALSSGANGILVIATDAAGNAWYASISITRLGGSNSGTVTVTITPQGAIDQGAKWRVNGGNWCNSAYTEQNVPTGPRFVEFMNIPGSYLTPAGFSVNVTAGQNISESRIYTFVFVPDPPNTPSNPSPAHGAVDVGRAQPRFSWSGAAPGGDLQYAFCIDLNNPTNPDPAQYTGWGSLTDNSFQFPDTSFTFPVTTTVNWRVKARANGITVDGPLWRFTTEYAVADLAVKNLALDGNVEPGANVTLSATVTNQGNFVAPLGYLFFYLSRTPGGKEIRLNLPVSLIVRELQPGQSTNITFSAKLDGLPAG